MVFIKVYYVIIIIFYPYRKLPHGLHKKNTEVCLFVKDLDRKNREHELTSDHFKDLLRSKGVTCVSEVSVVNMHCNFKYRLLEITLAIYRY